MPAKKIDGTAIAEEILSEVSAEMKRSRLRPRLDVVLVGNNPASRAYVARKTKAAAKVGIESYTHHLPENMDQPELLGLVRKLSDDPKVNGLLVQLPLPEQIDESEVLAVVSPEKDVDGFHAQNAGALLRAEPGIRPCTPAGIIELLVRSGIKIAGKHAVVVGRSAIVGKPVALMLLENDATVTVAHSRTPNLGKVTKLADILVVAAGRPKLITKAMVKRGAVVIDVGINRLGEQLVGDVDFASVSKVAGAISPVPGGVGPMTVAMLMKNTMTAALNQRK